MDRTIPVNIQLLLMLLLVSSLVGFCIGCFCLTRKDNQKLASTEILAACFKPSAPKPELDPRDKQQTKL